MSRMEVCPYSYFWWYGYFRGPGVTFVKTDKFSVRVTNFFQGLVSHELTSYLSVFKPFLFKPNKLWQYYQKDVN